MSNDVVVVVGGSFAGLVTARVLSEEFAQVVVVDRDELPDALVNRKGVPQTPHVHGIQQLGRQILDTLFPGFVAETQKEGALLFDQLDDIAIFNGAGWTARGASSVKGYGVRRALLEQVARRRVLGIPNVSVRRGTVGGLRLSGDGERIVGVELGEADGGKRRIDADLVVDASGRGSAAPRWLESLGFPTPEEEIVNGFVGYASRLYKVPDDVWPVEMRGIAQLPFPGQTRGGILYPQDNGLHVMSLFGQARDYPPSEPDAYLEFVATCGTPLMHEVVLQSEPVSEIFTSRSTANRLRHYESLARRPGGFVAIGDAAAVFNPIFGQGISTSCRASLLLRDSLHETDQDLEAVPAVFQAKLAKAVEFPWANAVGSDLRFPETVGELASATAPSPEAVEMGNHVAMLMELSTADLQVAEAVMIATQMSDGASLHSDELRAKARAWREEGRTPPFPDPAKAPSREDFEAAS